ncbi:tetraether lipid synthase Tes [Patescibacteria group bacterium]
MKKQLLKKTKSLCPVCLKRIPADVFEEDNKVFIEKECSEHGKFKDLYFGSAKMYKNFREFDYIGKGIKNPNTESKKNCPFDCGLCDNHKSHTALANIIVTNRCDLRCFYCFFYAKEGESVYEPSLEQIRKMLKLAKKEKPVSPNAIQLTGGNPELRTDLIEIIKICKEQGYDHVQLNTQGTHKLWKDLNFAKDIKKAGVNTIYLSFDGVSKKTNPKNHWEVPYILENLRKAKLGAVLVPTIIKGVNDQEIGEIINFALNNLDIIRGVIFQPVSLVGRMPHEQREKQRITIPEVISSLEKQSKNQIKEEDFYPISAISPMTKFIEALTDSPQYCLSSHWACGAATYLFLNENKVIPITRFIDVEKFFKYLDKSSVDLKNRKNKHFVLLKNFLNLKKITNKNNIPKNLNIPKLIYQALIKHNYDALGEFHQKTLLVGMMHFMDLYNYDIERVQRCCIHYLMPNKKIVPFCTFNVMPQFYRDKVQAEYSVNRDRKTKSEIYKRDTHLLEKGETYKQGYKLKNFFQ